MSADFWHIAAAIVIFVLLLVIGGLLDERRRAKRDLNYWPGEWLTLNTALGNERTARKSDVKILTGQITDYQNRLRELDRVHNLDVSTVRKAIEEKRAGGLYFAADGRIALTQPAGRWVVRQNDRWVDAPADVTFTFDASRFDTQVLSLYTAQKTPEQRIADLSAENNRLNEKLATEKEKSKHLRRWLKLLVHSTGSIVGVTERDLVKQDYRRDLRESLDDGLYSLRIRKHGLPDDVPEKTL